MSLSIRLSLLSAILLASRSEAQEWLDRWHDALTFSLPNQNIRARLSGTLDLEGYLFGQPPPGLVESEGNTLFNPRLSVFLDSQLGTHFYLFAQARVDRGFDPADSGVEARMDEYALRYIPWTDGRLNLQAGKFATVWGSWAPRHLSWDNPFVSAPLLYEQVTAVSDVEAPESREEFVDEQHSDGYEYIPVVWGPDYSTGLALSGGFDRFEGAVAVKNVPPSSRPASWSATDIGFRHPSVEGRLGFRPSPRWNLGLSLSEGPYFRPEALSTLPSGDGLGDYRQLLVGQDVSFAWHHVQLWAEVYQARFDVPRVGGADTFGWYLEGKYKVTPQFFAALRWNQQWFADVPDGDGGRSAWGRDRWRADVALGYRFTAHLQMKLQYTVGRDALGVEDLEHTGAAQLTLRF